MNHLKGIILNSNIQHISYANVLNDMMSIRILQYYPWGFVQVEDFLRPFQLSLEKLREVSSKFRKDLIRGLGKHTHRRAPVKMLPTFVRDTPDGTGMMSCDVDYFIILLWSFQFL